MTFDTAIGAAEKLASGYAVKLGKCLFSDPLTDASTWAFAFDIIGGPADWSWLVLVNQDLSDPTTILAVNHRPSSTLLPRIKRRWLLFGERQEILPLHRQPEFLRSISN